jgi:hypothetical protein
MTAEEMRLAAEGYTFAQGLFWVLATLAGGFCVETGRLGPLVLALGFAVVAIVAGRRRARLLRDAAAEEALRS